MLRSKLSLKAKHLLMLLVTLLVSVFVNLLTSAFDDQRMTAFTWHVIATVFLFIAQCCLAIFIPTAEEERLVLLNEAQDQPFRNAIDESKLISLTVCLTLP